MSLLWKYIPFREIFYWTSMRLSCKGKTMNTCGQNSKSPRANNIAFWALKSNNLCHKWWTPSIKNICCNRFSDYCFSNNFTLENIFSVREVTFLLNCIISFRHSGGPLLLRKFQKLSGLRYVVASVYCYY